MIKKHTAKLTVLIGDKPTYQPSEHWDMIKKHTAKLTVLIGGIKPVSHNKNNILWYYSVSQYRKRVLL